MSKAETVARQRYRNRVEDLERHLEVVDASLALLGSIETTSESDPIAQVIGSNTKKYPRLNEPFSRVAAVVAHARYNNSSMAVAQLYGFMSEYMREVLGLLYAYKPMLVVGKAPALAQLRYHEIVSLGSWTALSERIVNDVFRSLEEERSTKTLIRKVIAKTGADVPSGVLKDAIVFLEMRHLIVHKQGMIDDQFAKAFSKDASRLTGLKKELFEKDQKLPLRYVLTRAAIQRVGLLVARIDGELLREGVVQAR